MHRRKLLSLIVGGVASGFAPGASAQGDNWPHRPVRMIIPYAVGGPTDLAARAICARLSERLGQPFVVENRPGAGGSMATENVVNAAPDGYTLLYHTSGLASNTALYKNLRFDPRKDLAPVGQTIALGAVLLANPNLPAADPRQLFAYLKANPGKVSYGSGGIGNGSHLEMEAILQATGTKAIHVAYKGTAPAMLDLMRGDVQLAIDAVSTAFPRIREGRVRALAVLSATRDPALPNVPTLAESGIPGYRGDGWNGVWAPVKTPPRLLERISTELAATLADPQVRAGIEQPGIQLRPSTLAQFAALINAEIDRFEQIVRTAKITVE